MKGATFNLMDDRKPPPRPDGPRPEGPGHPPPPNPSRPEGPRHTEIPPHILKELLEMREKIGRLEGMMEVLLKQQK